MSRNTEHIAGSSALAFEFTDGPNTAQRLLAYLLDNAGRSFTARELRDALGLGRTASSVALSELAAKGVLRVDRVGRTGRFGVDSDDPLVRHLKISQAIARARQAISRVEPLIESATLFGSASRGEDSTGSDVDVLLVAARPDQVQAALARIEWLQPVVMTPAQYLAELAGETVLAREVADGIRIGGRKLE